MANSDKTGRNKTRKKESKRDKNMSKAPFEMPMEAPRIERGTVCRMQGQCKTEIIPLDHTPRACGNGDQRLCPRLVGLSNFLCRCAACDSSTKAGWWGSVWCLLPGELRVVSCEASSFERALRERKACNGPFTLCLRVQPPLPRSVFISSFPNSSSRWS